jgi:hypothetical protein
MKIAIATHLYPPDIAQPAPYVKELAQRLSREHGVTIVSMGHLPEIVEGAKHVPVSKSDTLPFRLMNATKAVLGAARNNDVLIVENGASIALPSLLASLLHRTPILFHEGDTHAAYLARQSSLLRIIDTLMKRRALHVIRHIPLRKPEVLPFDTVAQEDAATYEQSWTDHIDLLNELTRHAAK